MGQQSFYTHRIKNYLKQENKKRILALTSTMLLLLVLLGFASLFPFQDKQLKESFPKHESKAAGLILNESFGITAEEAAILNHGIKWEYGWNSYRATTDTTVKRLSTFRLGFFWWDAAAQQAKYGVSGIQQNFKAPATSCSSSFSLSFGTYCYYPPNIDTKVTEVKNNIPLPRYYVIGNEPNIDLDTDSDGDIPSGMTAAQRDELLIHQYKAMYDSIKRVDPQGTIIGPSTIGFSQGNGQAWFSNFLSLYRTKFGVPVPMDILNIHVYDLGVKKPDGTNVTDPAYFKTDTYYRIARSSVALKDLEDFRIWANNNYYASRPIMITEFGSLNCYDPGCYNIDKPRPAVVGGQTTAQAWLTTLTDYFTVNKTRLNIVRWMPYSKKGDATGMSTLNPTSFTKADGSLTTLGQWYINKATLLPTPTPTKLPTPTPTKPPTPTATPTPIIIQTFRDVPPGSEGYAELEKFVKRRAGDGSAISGCSVPDVSGKPAFCPTGVLNRAEMSKFMIVAKQDSVSIAGSVFTDMAGYEWAIPYAMRMRELKITLGCGDGTRYCPGDTVTRGTMVIFIGRAFPDYAGYTPPLNPSFYDVPYSTSEQYKAIEFAKIKGITNGSYGGCGYPADKLVFCPGTSVTRIHMAMFLMRAWPTP